MSDNENLADASWAAGLMGEEDWNDMQSRGQMIAEGKEALLFYIIRSVPDFKRLVENYAACSFDKETPEQLEELNTFFHEVLTEIYRMCVGYGIIDEGFWKEDDA